MDRSTRFDGEPGHKRIYRGIGQHMGRIEVELAAPDQPSLPLSLTLFEQERGRQL